MEKHENDSFGGLWPTRPESADKETTGSTSLEARYCRNPRTLFIYGDHGFCIELRLYRYFLSSFSIWISRNQSMQTPARPSQSGSIVFGTLFMIAMVSAGSHPDSEVNPISLWDPPRTSQNSTKLVAFSARISRGNLGFGMGGSATVPICGMHA